MIILGKLDQVPAYAASNEGEAVPYLRPLKSRPYRPRASHLAYSFTTAAMCDDLLPKSSGDTSVPVMSWGRVRKATDEAVITFPDIANAPVSIVGMADHAESRNSVSAMSSVFHPGLAWRRRNAASSLTGKPRASSIFTK